MSNWFRGFYGFRRVPVAGLQHNHKEEIWVFGGDSGQLLRVAWG